MAKEKDNKNSAPVSFINSSTAFLNMDKENNTFKFLFGAATDKFTKENALSNEYIHWDAWLINVEDAKTGYDNAKEVKLTICETD